MKYLVILVIVVIALAIWATWRASRKRKAATPVKAEVLSNQPSRSVYSSNYATKSNSRSSSAITPKSTNVGEVKPYRAKPTKTSKSYTGEDTDYVSDNWGYGYLDTTDKTYRDSDSSSNSGYGGSSYSSYDSGSSSSDSGSSSYGGSSSSSYDSGSSSGGSSSSD